MPRMKSLAKLKIRSKNKSYGLKDSPFYKLSTKRSLEKLLNTSISKLKILSENNKKNFNVFMEGNLPKQREIQSPNYDLNVIHTRIASLLVRIKTPDYLYSGKKGRSYITNAQQHIGDYQVLTMDIRKFYPSVSKKSIYSFFINTMKTSPDVAGILAEVCCYKEHIPTGSRISMPLAFWANHLMYSKIQNYCLKKDIKMTVYVDDLTFSGNQVNRLCQKNIERIITSCGFKFHPDKTRLYSKDSNKLITGVVVDKEKILLRNKHHKSIYYLYNELEKFKTEPIDDDKMQSLIGKMRAAAQIDQKFYQKVKRLVTDYNKRKELMSVISG